RRLVLVEAIHSRFLSPVFLGLAWSFCQLPLDCPYISPRCPKRCLGKWSLLGRCPIHENTSGAVSVKNHVKIR
ncbi:hypothetical protein C8R46DRAFT_1192537, partial [Mycena filopes]